MKEVLDFASSLQRATKAFLLYGSANHPKSREATESLIDSTEAMLHKDRVQIVASRGSLFVGGQLVGYHSPATDWLVEELNERQMNGIVITKGVTAGELAQIVKIFTLKKPQLDNLGGPAHLLTEVDAQHVRVSQTRYEEVRDGEIVIPKSQRGAPGGAAGDGWDPSAALDTITAGGDIADEDADKLAKFVVSWIQGRSAEASGDGDATNPGTGSPAAPGTPSFADLSGNLAELLRGQTAGLSLLQGRMKDLGISRSELDEILEVVAWENLSADERIARLLEGSMMFELPLEKVLTFILELVSGGRPEDAAQLVDRMTSGLFGNSAEHRKTAADGLQRVVWWIIDPGLPRVIEASVEKQLLTHFVKESDPQIQRRSQIAFMRLYDTWILRGQLEKALLTMRKLETVIGAASAANPWKKETYAELLDRLTNEERTSQLLELMYDKDLETVAKEYHPIFAFFGGRSAVRLLDALELEEDRSKRGRLIKAIKAIGKPALQYLEAALESPTWYLVRNALNVLGDLTAVDLIEPMRATLTHDDDRVRRAAVRALSKIGGVRIEGALVDALKDNSAETQAEILSALGALKAESAIDALVELSKPRRLGKADDPIRLKAIETIGTIGSAKAVAPLSEMLKKKGVLGGQEPTSVRKALCLALIAVGSLDAYKEVQLVAETDPDEGLRQELSKALWH